MYNSIFLTRHHLGPIAGFWCWSVCIGTHYRSTLGVQDDFGNYVEVQP